MNREEFEALTPEDQVKIFSETPLTEKSELILLAHEPGRLTRGLSSEELYLMTREVDLDEKAEILRYASVDQLSFLADMDCWERDQIEPGQFVRWLGTLLAADDAVLLRWIHKSDYETIIAGFQKFARVLKPDWETVVDDIVGDQPYFTLDRMYYILVEEESLETVKRALEILFENDRPRYFALLEGILGEMEYEMEEAAYRNREIRLTDRGFPDFETAMRAYTPLSREEFFKFPLKEKLAEAREHASPQPRYPVIWNLSKIFLDDVLIALAEEEPSIREGVYEELAWLSNKIVVCNGMDFTSEEKVRNAVDRARALVSLGLEILSEGDIQQGLKLVKERWLEAIFRFGFGVLDPMRKRVEWLLADYWKGDAEIFFTFLESPYEFILRGLAQPFPLCYDEAVTENVYHHRQFRSRQDVQRASLALEQMECLHGLLNQRVPGLFSRILRGSGLGGAEETLLTLCGNLWVRFVLSGKGKSDRLTRPEVEAFLKLGFEDRAAGRFLKADLKQKFMDEWMSAEERVLLMPFWGIVFQRIQEQMSRLNPEKSMEIHLLTCVSVKPADVLEEKTKPKKKSVRRTAVKKTRKS